MNNILNTIDEITAWLTQYEVKNYELITNEKYGYVVLSWKNLNTISVKFNIVTEDFCCNDNSLHSQLVGFLL